MGYRFISLLLLVCFNTSHAFTIGVQKSTFNTIYQAQLESAFSDLYSDIAVEVDFVYLPHKRMLKMVAINQIDAVAFESVSLNTIPDLIQVNEPLSSLTLYAGCLSNTDCHLDERTRYVVVSDATHAVRACEIFALKCLQLNSAELARKAVKDGLVDVYIMQRSPHTYNACPEPNGLTIYPIKNTEVDIYHYVHITHADIASKISQKIAQRREAFTMSGSCSNSEYVSAELIFDFIGI